MNQSDGKTVVVIFARHSIATKVASKLRTLTVEGILKCIAARHLLAEIVAAGIKVFCSNALRALQTAQVLIGDCPREITAVPEMFEHPEAEISKACEQLFAKYGLKNLKTYIETGEAEALLKYGSSAADALKKAIDGKFDTDTLIVSHAPLLNAMGYNNMFLKCAKFQEIMLTHSFSEAQMLKVTVDVETQNVLDIEFLT